MPTYEVTWTATLKGLTRVEADNPEEAEQVVCDDTDPPLDQRELSHVEVVAVELADSQD